MNILCDCCEDNYKFDHELYFLSYDDLKLFIKKKKLDGILDIPEIIKELHTNYIIIG